MPRTHDGKERATGHGGVVRVIGVVLLGVTIAVGVAGTVLLFTRSNFTQVAWGLPGGPGLWALGFSAAGYPITRRHSANPVGWCLMVAGTAAG